MKYGTIPLIVERKLIPHSGCSQSHSITKQVSQAKRNVGMMQTVFSTRWELFAVKFLQKFYFEII